jgi:hypothetical protein
MKMNKRIISLLNFIMQVITTLALVVSMSCCVALNHPTVGAFIGLLVFANSNKCAFYLYKFINEDLKNENS